MTTQTEAISLEQAAKLALDYMKSIGPTDMYAEEWTIVGRLEAALAAQPIQRTWVELTDAEIDECEGLANIRYRKHTASVRGQHLSPADGFLWHCARAIEAKLKEKNT